MLAFAIAAATLMLAAAAVSWLKRTGQLTRTTAALVGAGALAFLGVAIVAVALFSPATWGDTTDRGVGDRDEPTKVIDVQLPTL